MRVIPILVFIFISILSDAQRPLHEWKFEKTNPLKDAVTGKPIDTLAYKCPVSILSEEEVTYISSKVPDCLLPFSLFNKSTAEKFTLEIMFRGNEFFYTSFPAPSLRLTYKFDFIQFSTTVLRNNKQQTEHFLIKLDGLSAPAYSAIADNQWHLIVFRGDATTGLRQVLIDGKEYDDMTKMYEPASSFVFGSADAFKTFNDIGYVSIYNSILSDEKIVADMNQLNIKHINAAAGEVPAKIRKVGKEKIAYDPLEFAPTETVSTIDQLKQFPLPRFNPGVTLFRNVSWFDISYFARMPWDGKSGKKDINANAVSITDELSRRWNYYIEIPAIRADSATALKIYNNDESLEGGLVRYANQHPEFPVSTITFQAQLKPSHYGYNSAVPFIVSQKLPDEYYLRDESGKPVIQQGRKWISPLAPLDFTSWDGITAGSYVRQLNRVLKQPVKLISENGEVFGHNRAATLLKSDPSVRRLMADMDLSIFDFNGWFQYRLDSTYKSSLLRSSSSPNAYYTTYEVMAASSDYWPSFRMRLNTNSLFNNERRSTPSFYPTTPSNWRTASGPNLGYGAVAEGRLKEIKAGVEFFAPFVAAGWAKEEANVRPAQWLALLKAMVVLGADFFHVGYFNVTDAKGNWPNGKGPNDPSGYAYQVVMPAYAQALITLVPDIFYKGSPVNPGSKERMREFRFPGNNENELILVRKYGKKYLVYGSIQPMSNNKGNVPSSSKTQIVLDGKKIKFLIRRQGSMYVLDTEPSEPVFYQLDHWHQYEHPYFWSKEINIEAELYHQSKSAKIKTEQTAGNYDFTKFVSYVSVKKDGMVKYDIASRNPGSYKLLFIARSKGKSSLKYSVGSRTYQAGIAGNTWKKIDAGQVNLSGTGDDVLTIRPANDIEIDSIQLIPAQ